MDWRVPGQNHGPVLSYLVCMMSRTASPADVASDGTVGRMAAHIPEGERVNAADIVIDAVRRVEFGPLTTFRNLSVLGLSGDDDREHTYLTLDEALAQRSVHIVEVSEDGHVPELKIVNEGELPVLLLDGEELLGAKQNRVINLTILAPAHQTWVIPVSCVESGRWHHVSRGFAASPRAQFAEGRAAKMRQVTSSMMSTGSRTSDQQEVWSLIADKSARLGAVSEPRPCRQCLKRAMRRSRNSSPRSRQSRGRWAACSS